MGRLDTPHYGPRDAHNGVSNTPSVSVSVAFIFHFAFLLSRFLILLVFILYGLSSQAHKA